MKVRKLLLGQYNYLIHFIYERVIIRDCFRQIYHEFIFETLSAKLFVVNHWMARSKSCNKRSQLEIFDMSLNIFRLLVYSRQLVSLTFLMSLMKMLNGSGPKFDSCGTPGDNR